MTNGVTANVATANSATGNEQWATGPHGIRRLIDAGVVRLPMALLVTFVSVKRLEAACRPLPCALATAARPAMV